MDKSLGRSFCPRKNNGRVSYCIDVCGWNLSSVNRLIFLSTFTQTFRKHLMGTPLSIIKFTFREKITPYRRQEILFDIYKNKGVGNYG